MRITNNMLVRDMMWNVGSNLNKMSNYNNQLTTGKRVFRPSEDPVGVTQILKYKTDISALAQYKSNIEDAQGHMDVVESSLMNIKEVLQRIRELTVAAANGAKSKEDVDKIRVEIDELTNELISTGNATNAGRYI
ncbi:MAG: flagellar hook-associated protein FlgL, partial [Bacillota bacterium]|nr:flagellar hook-associated protein FlgL [Bacillota bacterium]